MKKFLTFISGVLVGALTTFLVCALAFTYEPNGNESSGDNLPDTFLDAEVEESTISRLSVKKKNITNDDVYETMVDSVLCSLFEIGYEAFPAYAVISSSNDLVPGIAYTDYTIYDDSELTIYSCGFYQIITEESEIGLSDELVENGVFVIPNDTIAKEGKYLMTYTNEIRPSSGIFANYYFKYAPVGKYSIKFQLYDNDREYWDEEIDLYDFNLGKYIFKSDLEYSSINALNMYEDEMQRYYAARDAYEQLVDIQNSNGLVESQTSLMLFSESIINQYILSNQVETLNNIVIDGFRNLELEEGQYIMVSDEGVEVKLTHEKEDELVKERMTNGIISAITNTLAIVGSVVAIVATCGTSTPVVVAVITITASSGAMAYSTSNLIEAGMDIYYSTQHDYTSNAFNPLLSGFREAFGDSKKTVIAYHAWGIASSIVSQFSTAIGKAVGAAISSKMNIALAVFRATIVTLAKAVTVTIVSTAINKGVIELVDALTGDIYAARIAGCVAAVTAGFFVAMGLEKFDQKYNISYNRQDYQEYAVLKKVEKIIKSVESDGKIGTTSSTALEKGNYGEMKMDQQMSKAGFKKVSTRTVTSLSDKSETGIDGIYYHSKKDVYVILDAKAGNSAALGNTADGRQMSKNWIFGSNRLKNSVPENIYNDILSHWSSGKVICGVCKVNLTTFDVLYDLLDDMAMVVTENYTSPLALIGVA